MKNRNVWVGIFVVATIVLFGAGLFEIGNKHKAFTHHVDFYTDFANVDEIIKGAKVRVDGMDAGEVKEIEIPASPAKKFRLKMEVEGSLQGLIRNDSTVTIETEGVVGNKFLLIHSGSPNAPEASPGATLSSKEPFEIGKLLERASGIMTQVSGTVDELDGTVKDVQGKLDTTLNSVTRTVNDTNGIVADVRHGKGAVGVLLENQQTAQQVQDAVQNASDATVQLKTATGQVNGILNDVQRRQLVAKVDDTLNNTKAATQQLDQASQQVNTTLKGAFGEDQYGQNAGSNLRQTLANVNIATGNLADDTEALKHEFFFKGFFKHRGYYSLDTLPVKKYRDGKLFKKLDENRQWIAADMLFQPDSKGGEMLSAEGRSQIDAAVSQLPDLYDHPLVVEGYALGGDRAEELVRSRTRASLVRNYLQMKYRVQPKDIGVVALDATPPEDSGKGTWDGVCLVKLSPKS